MVESFQAGAQEMAEGLGPFKKEENVLKSDVVDGSERRIMDMYKLDPRISHDRFMKALGKFNSDRNVINLMEQIPVQERSSVLLDAANLVDSGVSPDEAIQSARMGKDRSDYFLETETNSDIKYILELLYKKIDKLEDPFEGVAIPTNLSFIDKSIVLRGDGENRVLMVSDLPEGIQKIVLSGIESRYRKVLSSTIKVIRKKDPDISFASLFSDDEILKLYVKYYNVKNFYGGKPINYDGSLSEEDRQILRKNFKSDLSILGYEVGDVDADILRANEERERRIHEENQRRIRERKERNKQRNDAINNSSREIKSGVIPEQVDTQQKSADVQNATGAQIAADANLGQELDEYNLNVDNSEYKDEWTKETIFCDAWKNFIQSNDKIKAFITQDQMSMLFDINNNSINYSELEKFIEHNPLFESMSQDEKNEIKNILSGFTTYFSDVEKILSNNSSEMAARMNETVRTSAIGNVIDNVRYTFGTIAETQNGDTKGFQLNIENPIKKDGVDIIISGSFDGSDIEIHYNLKTGKLFINSLINKVENEKKFVIGNKLLVEIGEIKPFNDLLNDYYKLPPYHPVEDRDNESPIEGNFGKDLKPHANMEPKGTPPQESMGTPSQPNISSEENVESGEATKNILNIQMNLISEAIKDKTESQAQKNSIIIKFMKTFNIIIDEQGFETIEINGGSNLFDLIQIIENSDSNTLDKFQIFMKNIMEYSGLEWGNNNLLGSQNNDKRDAIFNGEKDNKYISLLIDNTQDFSKNPNLFSRQLNFDSNLNLGFAQMIIDNITNDNVGMSDKNLDESKMVAFFEDAGLPSPF